MSGFDPDSFVQKQNKSSSEQFHEERLDRQSVTKAQWPAQIDRAAFDVIYGIAIGQTSSTTDIGGTIDRYAFPEATGEFYVDGLRTLAGEQSNVGRTLSRYDAQAVGSLGFHLNEFRHELREIGDETMDIDRAVEALVEKAAVEALDRSVRVDGNDGAGLRQLRGSHSASDLLLKLFSDPRVEAYSDSLIDIVTDMEPAEGSLLSWLDEPIMTTPLWQHQQEALENWIEHGQFGYVDMATATGKTVLGLAAIATRYGRLHPVDTQVVPDDLSGETNPHILVVAGTDVLLTQWREEVDTHLDIPPTRTAPTEREDGNDIELGWGTIEFRTAQSLVKTETFGEYDLVILDEAHRYSRGRDGRGWGAVIDDVVSHSDAVLALSGSVDGGWQGDPGAKDALEDVFECCYRFSLPQARARGVIADFSWDVHYARATEEDANKLAEQTKVTTDAYDSLTGEIDTDVLDVPDDAMDSTYESYAALRSFAQSNSGSQLRERSESFDQFASALFTRLPVRWNRSPVDDTIVDLVSRHAPEQKIVVLVQNYDDATRLGERLRAGVGFDEAETIVLGGSNEDRSSKIQSFKALDSGVIIGPSDLLGVGVNMPDAEVAVNIARGNVNASLVQRIGRILRNPKGDKEAQFYHIVPQSTLPAAIDKYEDGQQLLRQAAAFSALGETFKERPTFSVATESVGNTIATLERASVAAFDRRSDDYIRDIAETDATATALRELYDAVRTRTEDADADDRQPVTVAQHPHSSTDDPSDSEASHDGLFTERNESYEQYRLSLDQYRAAKGVAEYLLDGTFDISRNDDGYTITAPAAYDGTAFHEQYERLFTEYKAIKNQVNGDDGEPGSLPLYRVQWPAPRKADGAMVDGDVAAKIGTDYAQDDPLFFPRENGELYELPLPDGRRLTVDGIVDPTEESATPDSSASDAPVVGLSSTLVSVASTEIDHDDELSSKVEEWSRKLLIKVLEGNTPAFASAVEQNDETVSVALSDDVYSFVKAGCASDNSPFETPDSLVETAVRYELDLEPTAVESVTAELPKELVIAAQPLDIDLDEVFEDALRTELSNTT